MKICIFNFNGVLDALAGAVYNRGDLVADWRDADVLVMWQDVIGEMAEIATTARMFGKKVYVVEHGLLSINDYIAPLNRPLIANKFLAWGEKSKEYLNAAGIENVVVTGTTIFDNFKPKRVHLGHNVLFAPRHWDIELPENIRIAKELKKLKVNVKSKIVEGEHNPDNYPNPMSSNRMNPNHLLACYEALKDVDVLVTLGEGTIASMAYYLDIPVVSSSEWQTKTLLGKEYTSDVFFDQVSEACHLATLNELNGVVMSELKHPEQNRKLRYKFLKEYLNYDSEDSAIKKQMEVIYG